MKTTQIGLFDVSEVSLIYKSKIPASERASVRSSKDAFDLIYSNWDLNIIEHREEFKILLLNRGHKALGVSTISTGGITGTVVDSRLIFQLVLKANATSVILVHNHPSGNLSPSEADLSITKKIKAAGEILDINVLDHLIVIPGSSYLSLADEGLM